MSGESWAGPDPVEHRVLRELLGAFVLGQLGPTEQMQVQHHLDGCPKCRAEVAALAPLVSSLRQVDPAALETAPEPPPELADLVVARIARDRRGSWRRRVLRRSAAAVLVAAALAGAVAAGVALRPTLLPGPPVRPVTLTVAAGIDAEAGAVRHTWGTELQLHASGLRQGAAYAIRFETRSGREVSAGSLIGTGDRTLVCSLNAAVPIEDATRVRITDPTGAVVVDGRIG